MHRQSVVMAVAALAVSLGSARAIAQGAPALASLYRESYRLEAQRDTKGALRHMERVLQLAPRSYFATVRRAWLAYLAGDYATAATGYRDAVGLKPAASEPRLGLTLALLAARRWSDLVRACRELIALDPKNALARARLAHALYSLGNYPEAAAQYRKLCADYPAELDHQTGLGWALLKLGRPAEARRLFEEVLEVSPDNANAKSGLGLK